MIRPTLAVSLDSEQDIVDALKLHGSLFVSRKYDGVRGIISSGVRSRTGELHPNIRIQDEFRYIPEGLDGEILFDMDNSGIFASLEDTNSIVSSKSDLWPRRWTPVFYAFDDQHYHDQEFRYRHLYLRKRVNSNVRAIAPVRLVGQTEVGFLAEVMRINTEVLDKGGEGICLRNPHALYKCGRSTVNDGALMRFKRVTPGIAYIQGFTNLLSHVGEQQTNSFGLAKRGNKISDMVAKDEIGAIIACNEVFGEFRIGSGFTSEQRKDLWKRRAQLIGKQFNFEYRDTTAKGKPRNATFVSL